MGPPGGPRHQTTGTAAGDSMEQIRLGQTELQVSRIAFGTWACSGDRGAADVDEAKASIHRVLELGINLFDTAQGYGFGAAERLLGEALWERARREEVLVARRGVSDRRDENLVPARRSPEDPDLRSDPHVLEGCCLSPGHAKRPSRVNKRFRM